MTLAQLPAAPADFDIVTEGNLRPGDLVWNSYASKWGGPTQADIESLGRAYLSTTRCPESPDITPQLKDQDMKNAVQVDLVHIDDPRETLRFQAVLTDGKLSSSEMYCHLYEWSDSRNDYELQPGILTDEEGTFSKFVGEWGYGDKSSVTFHFLDRPLAVGQEITRTDKDDGQTKSYFYQITAITDLLA